MAACYLRFDNIAFNALPPKSSTGAAAKNRIQIVVYSRIILKNSRTNRYYKNNDQQ
jgi:hypothetical protein